MVALRFSQPLQVQTVTSTTVTLSGPGGDIPAKVIRAEQGWLAFVTPQQQLQPDAGYTLSLSGLSDHPGQVLSDTTIHFSTAGGSPLDDEAWTPQPGNNWRTGRPESPWQELPPLQAPAGVTAVAGQVLRLQRPAPAQRHSPG